MIDPLVTILSVTYGHSYHQLRIFLSSLVVQTDQRFICYVMHDGPDLSPGFITAQIEYGNIPNFKFTYSEKRENCYGHNLREYGLHNYVMTPYLIFENSDNYLVPKAVELALKGIQENDLDFLIFNCCHNYAGHWWGRPDYIMLDVAPQTGHCDMGSFIIKSDLAKRVGFPHRVFHADGIFIDSVMQTNPNWGKLKDSILMVHN